VAKIRKEEKLPSCEVKFDLIRELEKYLFNELPKTIAHPKEYLKIDYSILIEDNFGIEEIKTIDDYSISKFTESTNRIELSLRIRPSREKIRKIYIENKNIDMLSSSDQDEIDKIENMIPYLSIDINLRKIFLKENIKIEFEGENARSSIVAIYDAIMRIFDTYKNHNYLYNPSFDMIYWLFIINVVIASFSISFLIKGFFLTLSTIGLSIFMIYIVYIIFGRRTHPYFLFESKKAEMYKRWNNWFLYNVLFIVVINIVLVLLRKYNYY
jgi:hypothetical protein